MGRPKPSVKRLLLVTLLIFAAAALLLLTASWVSAGRGHPLATFTAPTGSPRSSALRLELASTPSQRTKGLMYRRSMAPDEGMLFIFPDEQPRSFWMKNTYLSLDMIFLDKSFTVVSVVHNAQALTTKQYESLMPAMFVVELVAGQAKRLGIEAGWKLEVSGPLPLGVGDEFRVG